MKFNLARFVEIVDRLAPAVLAVVPNGEKIAPLVPRIVHGIKEAQAIKGATGEEKKKHVLAAITDGATVAAAAGAHVSSEEIVAIASKGIDTVIEAVHVIEGAKAARAGEAASSSAAAPGSGSLPGVDTAPRSSDLPGGHATHGHGSADLEKAAPAPGDPATVSERDGPAAADAAPAKAPDSGAKSRKK